MRMQNLVVNHGQAECNGERSKDETVDVPFRDQGTDDVGYQNAHGQESRGERAQCSADPW